MIPSEISKLITLKDDYYDLPLSTDTSLFQEKRTLMQELDSLA